MECEEDAAEDEREKVEAGTFQASRTYSTLNVARWLMVLAEDLDGSRGPSKKNWGREMCVV